MADHERGEVVAWLCTPTTIGFGAHEVVGSPEERDHYAGYRHTIEPLVRQSDYLEAVADLNTVRALVEQQNAALTEAADEIERLRAEVARLDSALDAAVAAGSENSQIKCLVDIRYAVGDNGLRMQDELVEYIKGIVAERDELRARIEGIDKILEPLTGEG